MKGWKKIEAGWYQKGHHLFVRKCSEGWLAWNLNGRCGPFPTMREAVRSLQK